MFKKKYFLLLLLSLVGCDNDNKAINEDNTESLNVYYLSKGGDTILISNGDTIQQNLGDSVEFFIETSLNLIGLFGDKHVELTRNETDNLIYSCKMEQAGVSSLGAFAYSFDEEAVTNIEKEKYFFIKIPSWLLSILVVEDPDISIEANSDVKEAIEKKLTDQYSIPTLFNSYKLNVESLTEGNVTCTTATKDTIIGEYSSSDISLLHDLAIQLNNKSLVFTIEKATDREYGQGYWLKQDFTEEFQKLYPDANVSKVAVSTLAIINQ